MDGHLVSQDGTEGGKAKSECSQTPRPCLETTPAALTRRLGLALFRRAEGTGRGTQAGTHALTGFAHPVDTLIRPSGPTPKRWARNLRRVSEASSRRSAGIAGSLLSMEIALGTLALLAMFAVIGPASAQTIYKCQVDGRIEYSGSPCWNGAEVRRIAPDGGPTAEDRARARMRVNAELARREIEEAARIQAISEYRAGQAAAAAQAGAEPGNRTAAASESEKVLTHDASGWDRKPRAQIEAEEAAKQLARDRARGGNSAPAGSAASASGNRPAWESEKVLTHSASGWDQKTRAEVVRDSADREFRREKQRLNPPAMPAGVPLTDNRGNTYSGPGGPGTYIRNQDGRTCQFDGAIVRCNSLIHLKGHRGRCCQDRRFRQPGLCHRTVIIRRTPSGLKSAKSSRSSR